MTRRIFFLAAAGIAAALAIKPKPKPRAWTIRVKYADGHASVYTGCGEIPERLKRLV